MQEVIQKLRDSGHSDLIDCLLENEKECYTKKGRLNKSKTCRKLNKKSKWLEDTLRDMREILKKDFDIEEEQGA
jgi:hypothetical protein